MPAGDSERSFDIQRGANFTHVFFRDKAELDQYIKDHAERFEYILGQSSGKVSDGLIGKGCDLYRIVF